MISTFDSNVVLWIASVDLGHVGGGVYDCEGFGGKEDGWKKERRYEARKKEEEEEDKKRKKEEKGLSYGYCNLYSNFGRKAHLLEDKQIPSVGVFDEVFSTWMAFGGNTRDLGSFGEETDEITDLHQILEEILLTERAWRRRRKHKVTLSRSI
ncbi:hypothetical protein Tco_0695884 [Tanacetum coccineum]